MQRLVARSAARDVAEAAVPGDEWVRRERRAYEASRRAAGDNDYRYPARYLGREAADQPAPDERCLSAVAHNVADDPPVQRNVADTGLER